MTWGKFSDDFGDDCWQLSDAAFRLHVEALLWNARKLLDCRIPKDDLRRFAKTPDAVTELLDVGWWTNDVGAYFIRHHASYQPTREAVLKRQAANAANGRMGGRPKKVTREISELSTDPSETQSVSESKTQGDRTGKDRKGSYGSESEVSAEEVDEALADHRREYTGGPVDSW